MDQLLENKQKEVKKKHVKHSILTPKYLTPVGNKIMPIYELQYDEKAKKELAVIVGEQDIDDFIQKSASSTDMAFLQREAIRTGQYPIDPKAQYGVDMTIMPRNIHELYATTKDIKVHYEQLGKEAQAAFGSAENYKNAVLDGTAEKLLQVHFAKLAKAESEKIKKQKKEDKEVKE